MLYKLLQIRQIRMFNISSTKADNPQTIIIDNQNMINMNTEHRIVLGELCNNPKKHI
jgi:hypothetical protein